MWAVGPPSFLHENSKMNGVTEGRKTRKPCITIDKTLFIRKFLSEEEFNNNFNTVDLVKNTLVCFSLEDKKPPWKLWGYAYNNPRVEHAEIIVLRELSKFFGANPTKIETEYKITLYASYSPCLNCCEEVCKFLINSKEKIIMNLNISKFYNFHDYDNKISLKMMRENGVCIKMMNMEEYKACFYLFVDPNEQFKPCEELDIQCERNEIELDHLWSEEFEDYLFRRRRPNSVFFASEDFSPGHNNNALIRLQEDIATPKKNKQEKESQAKTPVKLPPLKYIDCKETLKRKLTFD
ncbi:DNA dC-_dU-editing enzyme APOBEC3-like [Hyla sarda]|uniref:DNA dC->dU-editing enzyme APOBEC3-like n=1 Tax=Hyla sarda TaxID=327740 RepID=UPI0024C298A9|nr:DNA dC->dU-editing enzyme APOBEC3-like [Hyla sarda]